MSLTFPRVAPVAKGQRITSAQIIALASSFNTRVRSGLGDMAWRKNKWFENYSRQFRNPDESGFNFPSQAEWTFFYMLIDSDKGIQAPVAGPGEPEGANLVSTINQFPFGNTQLAPEDVRLGDNFPLWLDSGPISSLTDYWELGKRQRGAIESGGLQATPALSAALSWISIGSNYYSPHGKGQGGYYATPTRLLDSCDSLPGTNGYNVPSVEYKFTDTDTGDIVTYPGSCQPGTEFGGAGQVIYIRRLPIGFFVYVDDGFGSYTIDSYPRPQWIEGEYTGAPELAHTEGEHTERSLFKFLTDFHGTNAQRTPDTYDIQNIAFDFQAFLTKQYPLSPNFGYLSGDGIEAQYPTARLAADSAADTLLPFDGTGTTFTYQPGFVCAGIFAKATNLSAECVLQVLDEANAVIGTLTLAPGALSDAMLWLDNPSTPETLRCKLATAATFTGSGTIQFEATQLFPYKPQYWDAYLVLRETATRGGFDFEGTMDGVGSKQTDSKEIYESLATAGCILNRHGVSGPMQIDNSITATPVYDTMRRWARECMRIVPKENLLSYEVAGGKSILRFKRYAFGADDGLKADMFCSIAPPYQPVEEMIAEETYIVRSGGTPDDFVSTSAGNITNGQTFTAVASDLAFELFGDAQLYIYDGIRTVARPKGLSNEWVMHPEFHAYHWSDSSQWKDTAYDRYFTGVNRCHFQSATIPSASSLAAHINYTPAPLVELVGGSYVVHQTSETVQQTFVNPEAPSGMNYADGSNSSFHVTPKIPFYKSCQIYQAPYEVESCTVQTVGGIETVTVTFTGRFRSHESAPATVSADVSTWTDPEIYDLRVTEDYRTDDNAFREWALLQGRGTNASWKVGDSGSDSNISFIPDNPYGAIMPKMFFTKLLEKPYEDGNDTVQLADTRCVADIFQHAEIWLATGCEGFVDGLSTQARACASLGLYDYKMDTLCLHAFGGSCISPIDPDVQVDVAGYGPLPNTTMYATHYNQLAACVNLLTKARIALPMQLKVTTDSYLTNYEVTPTIQFPISCATGADSWAIWEGGPASPAFVGSSGPVFTTGAGGVSSAFFGSSPYCSGTGDNWNFGSSKSVDHFTCDLIDADALYAVPALLQDLITANGTGFLAQIIETIETVSKSPVSILGDAQTCGGAGVMWDGSTGYKLTSQLEYIQGSPLGGDCVLMNSGSMDPGTAPSTLYAYMHSLAGADECSFGGSHNIGFSVVGAGLLSYFSVPLV